jgi:hypothetical protein
VLHQIVTLLVLKEERNKTAANFCAHFKPRERAYVAKDTAELTRARSALDDLFRK